MNSALTVQFKQLSLFLIICVHLKQDYYGCSEEVLAGGEWEPP